jgi:hypothetical protein
VKRLAALIEKRLGRPLEPFDIWYAGFSSRAGRATPSSTPSRRRSTPRSPPSRTGLPAILTGLGFTPEKGALARRAHRGRPSRGAGHAMGAVRREDKAHLRTRIPSEGMLYKGYNIAIHELGHNVEQSFSLGEIDQWSMNGVPQQRVHRGPGVRLPGARPRAARRRRGDATAEQRGAERPLGRVRDRRRGPRRHGVWRFMYAHPTRPRPSFARPRCRSRATSGIATTPASSASKTSRSSPSTRT